MTDKVSLFALRSAELALRSIAAELDCKVLTIQFDNVGDGRFWLSVDRDLLAMIEATPEPTLIAAYRAAKERAGDE